MERLYLEIFSRPQVLKNPRQYSLLRTDILQEKQPLVAPEKIQSIDCTHCGNYP